MPSNKEEEEESNSEEWRSDVITHNDFDFDESSVFLKVRLLPNKSAMDFFKLIFTDDLYNLIVTENNRYATQQRKEPLETKKFSGLPLLLRSLAWFVPFNEDCAATCTNGPLEPVHPDKNPRYCCSYD